MKFFKLSLIFLTGIFFLTGCGSTQTDEIIQTYPNETMNEEIVLSENEVWARENLDLQRVGSLLEEADDAEEFEYLLNSENGINNLDLNGDGYVDYISVREFDERYDDERGFSLFTMFGPNEIQEIASIIFNRNGNNYPGARVLLSGNEQIYGDNFYYETNWLDRSLAIVNWAFGSRDDYYRSPYYYENYPSYYEVYEVVETPVYRTRIEEYYPAPVFIQTVQPTITQIKIKSPYKGKSLNKIYSKLAKPTKEQNDFRKNNPRRPEFIRVKNEKSEKVKVKFENKAEKNPNRFENIRQQRNERIEKRNNSEKVPKQNVRENKPNRVERPNMPQNNPNRVEKQNRPNKVERQNKPNKESKPNNGGQNRGNGGGKGNGKGNGKGKN